MPTLSFSPSGVPVASGGAWGTGGMIFTPNPNISSGGNSNPLGSLIFNPTYSSTPTYNPNSSTTGGVIPNVIATANGMQVQSTTLDKILGSVLSGMAIIKNAAYVPTTIQPQTEPTIVYQQPMGGGGLGGDGTAAGKVENWLKNNTGVALMGAGALVLSLMKPPSRSR